MLNTVEGDARDVSSTQLSRRWLTFEISKASRARYTLTVLGAPLAHRSPGCLTIHAPIGLNNVDPQAGLVLTVSIRGRVGLIDI